MDNLQALTVASETAARLLAVWSWQALLLLTGVWLTLKLFRSSVPAVRYQVWLLALLAVTVLPLWAIAVSWFPISPVSQPRAESFAPLIELPEAVMFPGQTQPVSVAAGLAADKPGEARAASLGSLIWNILFAVWASGALITAGRIHRLYWRLRRARHVARPASIADLSLEQDVGCEPSNSKQISIRLSLNVQSPILFGVRHPTILLPADIHSWTTAEERAAILRHELAHLERRDHYANLFQALLSIVFFFHPLVRYTLNQLSFERELACDERVLIAGTAATAYANSLLKVAERNLMPAEAQHQPTSFATRKTLERRVEMVLNNQPQASNIIRWSLLALSIAVIASITSLIVPSRPVVAAASQQQQQRLQASRLTENTPVATTTTIPVPTVERRTAVTSQPSNKQNQSSAETASTRRSLQKPVAAAALPARTSSKPMQNSDDEQAIRSLLREAADANVQNNLAILNRIIADDYVATGLRGEIMNKAEALAHFKVGDHKYDAVEVNDLKVRVFDNTAVATYIVTAKGKYRGEDFSVQNRNTTMLVKRQGRWQAIADQQTRKQ